MYRVSANADASSIFPVRPQSFSRLLPSPSRNQDHSSAPESARLKMFAALVTHSVPLPFRHLVQSGRIPGYRWAIGDHFLASPQQRDRPGWLRLLEPPYARRTRTARPASTLLDCRRSTCSHLLSAEQLASSSLRLASRCPRTATWSCSSHSPTTTTPTSQPASEGRCRCWRSRSRPRCRSRDRASRSHE